MCRLPLAAAVAVALVTLAPCAGAATWTTSGGLGGGRVVQLAVDPAVPTHAVAIVERSDDSEPRARLFETADAGHTWIAGAAEVAGGPVGLTTGVVVTDGAVWISTTALGPCRAATAAGPFACASAGGPFRSLVAVPGQPGTLLATTRRELQRSVDGGATWAPPPGFAADSLLALDPATPGAVYGSTERRVMRSVDGGLTWTTTSQDNACQPSSGRVQEPGLLADPSVAGRLYARTDEDAIPLCRSDDGGATWAPVSWPAAALGEDQTDAAPPGLAVTASGVLVAGSPAGAHRSLDGGVTWTRVADLGERAVGPVAAAGATVYAGSMTRGVYVSDDGGATFRHASAGLPETPADDVEVMLTPGSDVVYGTLLGEVLRSDDGGATWSVRAGGTLQLRLLALDPADGTLYAFDDGPDHRLMASTDGGLTFTTLARGAPFTRLPRLLHVSRSRPRVLVVHSDADGQLWRSTDDGRTWRRAGPLRGFTDLAFDAVDPRRIAAIVAIPGGRALYLSANGGTSWRRSGAGTGNLSIDADPVIGGRLRLVQVGAMLLRSTNGGRTFVRQPMFVSTGPIEVAGKTLVSTIDAGRLQFRPGVIGALPRNVLVASNDEGRSWTTVDAPLPARLGVTVGATMLLAPGPRGTVLRTPLPLATARLLAPPRVIGSALTGRTLRCAAARVAGATQSTTAVASPGFGPIVRTATYRVPRAPGLGYACATAARTPLGIVLASSAIVYAPGRPAGGRGGGEGGG